MKNVWHWIFALGLVCAGLIASRFLKTPADQEQATLRAQFHLPSEFAFAETRIKRPTLKDNSYELEGVVRLSNDEYARYRRQITAKTSWAVPALTLDGQTTIGSTGDPDALWQPLDRRRTVSFGNLNYDEFQRTTDGLAICYKAALATTEGSTPGDGVLPCLSGGTRGERGYLVQGVLDDDTRTMFLIIRRYGDWPLF